MYRVLPSVRVCFKRKEEESCYQKNYISFVKTAVPESEKLITISNYFGVSVDFLLKDDEEDKAKATVSVMEEKPRMIAGIIICIAGIVSMVIWGLVSIFSPEASDQISDSSMITIDGNGIFLILCVVAIVVGASLLLKSKKK